MPVHNISPVFDKNSKILILGSFPSVKSREMEFFYAHPQNRFWRVLSGIYNCPAPLCTEEKKRFLLTHGIALWDVIESCDITGSADSSISNVKPNDISIIINAANISKIICNGNTAFKLYNKYLSKQFANIKTAVLPSTSPANAACSIDRLIKLWQNEIIFDL